MPAQVNRGAPTRIFHNDVILRGCCGEHPERFDMGKKKNHPVTRDAAGGCPVTRLADAPLPRSTLIVEAEDHLTPPARLCDLLADGASALCE